MLNTLRGVWIWFVEGLVEAALWAADRARRRPPLRVELSGGGTAVVSAGELRLGGLVDQGEGLVFEPPDLARRLAGAMIDIVIPDAWMQRRDLDPVALASRPFLDAFVRHQIERITPWRVGDTYYRVLDRPMADDAGRLAVAVVVVPRRLVAKTVAMLEALGPRALRLRCNGDVGTDATIPLGASRPQRVAVLRASVLRGLAVTALAVLGVMSYLQWQAGLVRGDIDDQDQVLNERKATLARARRGNDSGGEAAARLRSLRDSRNQAVVTIEALAAALPDSAHLTALSIDGDRLTVAGVTSVPSSLVPALETSGAFAEVAFGSATTPAEGGNGDRFSLTMRALPRRSDHAAPPSPETIAPAARQAP